MVCNYTPVRTLLRAKQGCVSLLKISHIVFKSVAAVAYLDFNFWTYARVMKKKSKQKQTRPIFWDLTNLTNTKQIV